MRTNKKILLASLPFILTGMAYTPLTLASTSQRHSSTNIKKSVGDSIITTAIKAKIALNKALNPFNIKVQTKKGIVALSGDVSSKTAYSKAITIAQSVDGVKVIDAKNLTVNNSKTPLTDLGITARIRGKILQKKLFNEAQIGKLNFSIETRNRVVYLNGKVESSAIRDNLLKIIRSVDGVKNIKDLLKVQYK